MRGERVELRCVGGQTQSARVQGIVADARLKRVAGPKISVSETGLQPARHLRTDLAWKENRGEDHRAGDADKDLLDPRQRDIENQTRRIDARKSDQRRRVAGQDEHVTARRAVEQRKIQAACDPRRNCEAQHLGRVDEIGRQRDRHSGAENCPASAIERLRARRAGQRLRADIDGRDGPVGTLQLQPETDVERRRRASESLEREHPIAEGIGSHQLRNMLA